MVANVPTRLQALVKENERLSFCTPSPNQDSANIPNGTPGKLPKGIVSQRRLGTEDPCLHILTLPREQLCQVEGPHPTPQVNLLWRRKAVCHPHHSTPKPLKQIHCGHKNVHVSLYKKVSLHLTWRQELAVAGCSTTWRLLCRMFILKALKKFLYFLQSGVKAFSFCVAVINNRMLFGFYLFSIRAHLVITLFHMRLFLVTCYDGPM